MSASKKIFIPSELLFFDKMSISRFWCQFSHKTMSTLNNAKKWGDICIFVEKQILV